MKHDFFVQPHGTAKKTKEEKSRCSAQNYFPDHRLGVFYKAEHRDTHARMHAHTSKDPFRRHPGRLEAQRCGELWDESVEKQQ